MSQETHAYARWLDNEKSELHLDTMTFTVSRHLIKEMWEKACST